MLIYLFVDINLYFWDFETINKRTLSSSENEFRSQKEYQKTVTQINYYSKWPFWP